MKRILFILFLCGLTAAAQTDGLVYQAVILDPNQQEIPGMDVSGNILPNADLMIQFSIIDGEGGLVYQERQSTTTDDGGQIKVIIGQGEPVLGIFTEIDWDGRAKDLQVDINLDGEYKRLSQQPLLFIPYAYHRNITATGNVDIDGSVFLFNNLTVDGQTNLNDILRVNNENPVRLTGTMEVGLKTTLNDSLTVTNQSETILSGRLQVVDSTQLNQTLTVGEATKLRNTLDVVGQTTLQNELKVLGQNNTFLSGSLSVDGISNFNNVVNINNGSPLNLSGELNVDGNVTLNNDLTVQGETNLNDDLDVNNQSPTNMSGTLNVGGQTTLQQELTVFGSTDMENQLRVNNASPTNLSGTLEVGLATNLNSDLNVNNGSPTLLTGPLNVSGEIDFGNDLTVDGITNLFGDLNVNNASPVVLSGTLGVDGVSNLSSTLDVDGITTLNNDLIVAQAAATNFTGTLVTEGQTDLNGDLYVNNGSVTLLTGRLDVDGISRLEADVFVINQNPSLLSGSLAVDGVTDLNAQLEVLNAASTLFSGTMDVAGISNLNNELNVTNQASTVLSGTLEVDALATFNFEVDILALTRILNDLTVTGSTEVGALEAGSVQIESDSNAFVASFSNLDDLSGGGISIRLGKNHGRWINGGLLKIDQTLVSNDPQADPPPPPTDPTYVTAFNSLKNKFVSAAPEITVNDVIALLPAYRNLSILNINNIVFDQINVNLGLPKNLPSVTLPGFTLPAPFNTPTVLFPGINGDCSGQECFSVCFPFVGCTTVCVPPVNVCVPDIPPLILPTLQVPNVNIAATIPNYLPSLPIFPEVGLPNIDVPTIPLTDVPETLSSDNEYFSFVDVDDRQTGSVRAQSIEDFVNNTILDDVYVLNVASEFVGVDLADGLTSGATTMVNLIKEFNELGVEYASGNGDYAEWLERMDVNEYITAGDIVAVKGGKITKDLSNYEQIMVVSHRPIVLGNAPDPSEAGNGNTVAFIGQVPVKVMGPVKSGDYIIARSGFEGYGIAVSPCEMKTQDFPLAVGRSWQENLLQGPKTVNVVVGLQNGDFKNRIEKLASDQTSLDNSLSRLQQKLNRIKNDLNSVSKNTNDYASYE